MAGPLILPNWLLARAREKARGPGDGGKQYRRGARVGGGGWGDVINEPVKPSDGPSLVPRL